MSSPARGSVKARSAGGKGAHLAEIGPSLNRVRLVELG